ncbi:MAG: hypothetical protein Q7T18_12855, partial [Sedimentisphaerales bacterium]|nr:hypothetical protein [Sedimentisphaerales bacterium]
MSVGTIETRFQLGQVLLSQGIVTADQIDAALEQQSSTGHRKLLGELLVETGCCTENEITSALAHAYGLPYAQISPKLCDASLMEILPREFIEEHIVLPLFK